ncbi:TLD domain-containing protein 2-like isoform X2 [Momordica charantia]|uniref:TLD domain-containing protein 2-like isoform X2 n=1 Tax=Momordica charantia TaxID=3673 RepID=A0A6J1CAP2_MOMCH|nr:TLD domain-containing protein 2-like isoform X2 [Momordica charantia]
MHSLKEKVFGLFSNSTSSSSSKSSPPDPRSQARPKSKGRKSLSSYFSLEEGSDTLTERSLVCKTKEVPSNQGENEDCGSAHEKKVKLNIPGVDDDPASGKSTCSSDVFEEAMERPSPRKPLSDLTDESCFISEDLYEFLGCCLPNIVKGCKWILMYSTAKHGISLRTLIRKSHDLSGPCLLIVGDTRGAIFGGLLECPLEPTPKRKYQGTSQTFVFTTKYGEPRLFRPTGANHYYYICLNDLLALGGGGSFALCLDGELLSGTSGPCDTFGSLCLAHDPEFELKNVELWGFAHASRYFT